MGRRRVGFWECDHCGAVKLKEKEVLCWECGGKGEMIYQESPEGWMVIWEVEEL